MHAKLVQAYLTLCNPRDSSLPGSSFHEILQARILQWVAIFFLQGVFPTQRSHQHLLHLLHWQGDSLPLRHLGSPCIERWQTTLRRAGKNTQKNKKDLHDPDNNNVVITHLKPDILEWEVKWALGSTTIHIASGGDGIPAELYQILKDNAVNSVCQQIWKTQQWSRTGKG